MKEPTLIFWINGKVRIQQAIEEVSKKFDEEIIKLNKKLSAFHVKKIKNKEYWYAVGENGKWKYCGAVKKQDPQIQVLKEISKTEQSKKTEIDKIKSSVINEVGNHLIVDYNVYSPNSDEVIGVYEILSKVKEAITEKS